jgi:mono/diheme cytochrome c family protein
VNLPLAKGLACSAALLAAVFVLSSCAGKPGLAGTPSSGSLAERGERLYQHNCQSCHGGATGGGLRDIPPPHNANGHTWEHADQLLTKIILEGVADPQQPQQMPAFKDRLTNEDVQAILTYIKTWWTEEQRQFQAKATAEWDR